jgi:hypothetical protein
MAAKLLARMNIGDVHLDGRHTGRKHGVKDGNRRMGVGGRVEDDAGGLVAPRLLDPLDDLALPVRLPELDC